MQKLVGFTILFLFLTVALQAQTAAKVDSIMKLYPKSFTSVVRLSERIKKDFSSDFSRARAIYDWIAFNIAYDDDLRQTISSNPSFVYKGKTDAKIDDSVINQVLVKRKAVCDGYSRLFNRLATLTGLESTIISGNAKTMSDDIGVIDLKRNHSWNSVKIDGVWRLIDVTWGSGASFDGVSIKSFTGFYFDTPPKLFFLNHYPQDGQWQGEQLNKEQFSKLPVFYLNNDNASYEIIAPPTGIIATEDSKIITFRIANLKEDSTLQYKAATEYSVEIVDKKQLGNVFEFEVAIDKIQGDCLTLFIDGQAFTAYKITIK